MKTLICAPRSQENLPIGRAKTVKHNKNTQGNFTPKIWNIRTRLLYINILKDCLF